MSFIISYLDPSRFTNTTVSSMFTRETTRLKCAKLNTLLAFVALALLVLPTVEASAQANPGDTLYEGAAVVRYEDNEYTIPIECDDASRPELGFNTEPNRTTRERTGRTSMVNFRLRPSGEPDESIVSFERYVAWIPQPTSAGGVLSMSLDLSPITVFRNGAPVLLTRDMWLDGDRPAGISGVEIEAQCTTRDPEAPSFRKID